MIGQSTIGNISVVFFEIDVLNKKGVIKVMNGRVCVTLGRY